MSKINKKVLHKIFGKCKNQKKERLSKEDINILDNLKILKLDLDYLYDNLNFVTDPVLIDSFIYEIKAKNMRYKFYLDLCKKRRIIVNYF